MGLPGSLEGLYLLFIYLDRTPLSATLVVGSLRLKEYETLPRHETRDTPSQPASAPRLSNPRLVYR